jgi:hypothetical protein
LTFGDPVELATRMKATTLPESLLVAIGFLLMSHARETCAMCPEVFRDADSGFVTVASMSAAFRKHSPNAKTGESRATLA